MHAARGYRALWTANLTVYFQSRPGAYSGFHFGRGGAYGERGSASL